jgi:DNA-binding transcriptional LysR family regulator
MRIFAQIAVSGGYAAASRKLNLGTAVLSRSVVQLEEHMGVRLLNRTTRNVSLTEAGERYLRNCLKILASIEEAEAEAGAATREISGCLRVHAMSSFGHDLVLPASLRYQRQFPKVRVELTLSGEVPDMIEGGYDTSIVLAPELPSSGLVSVRLGAINGVICASPSYIRECGQPKSPKDLSSHSCLLLTTPVFPSDRWVFEGPDSSYSVDIGEIRFTANTPEALAPAVASGLGIGLMPVSAALPKLMSGELVRVLPEHAVQPVNVYVLYQSRRFLDAKIRAWVDLLREGLPAVLAGYDEAMLKLDSRATSHFALAAADFSRLCK